jgi:glycosyltransferase involved in cell wall biosynthesis
VARNRGAKYAKGDILILIDADMEFEPDFVKHLVQPIKMGKVKGTFSKQEYVANWESAWARCWNWNQNLPSRSRLPADHPNVGTDFRAILKSEFQRVNGFDDVGYTDTWTLPKKLGYQPIHAPGAKFYHYNPTSLHEIFAQARWASKRQYKLGLIGKGTALIRASLPVSLAVGIVKSLRYLEPAFLIFKIVYDLGTTIGIIENTLTGKTAK